MHLPTLQQHAHASITILYACGSSGLGSWKRRIRLDTDVDTDTDIFKIHFYINFTKRLSFIPNVVFTAAFASRPRRQSCHSTHPFKNTCAKDRLAL